MINFDTLQQQSLSVSNNHYQNIKIVTDNGNVDAARRARPSRARGEGTRRPRTRHRTRAGECWDARDIWRPAAGRGGAGGRGDLAAGARGLDNWGLEDGEFLEASWVPSPAVWPVRARQGPADLACGARPGASRPSGSRRAPARVKSWLRLPQKARRAGWRLPPARGPVAAPGA